MSTSWLSEEAVPDFREGASLDAQTLPTLCPTCVQHFSTTLGGHAGTEPMSALSLQVTRLKSSFHDFGSGEERWVKGGAILWTPWQAVNLRLPEINGDLTGICLLSLSSGRQVVSSY